MSDDPEVIEREIEQTREDMTGTIDAIQNRLDPERITEQARDAATDVTVQAKDAAIEVTEQARDAAMEVTRYAIDEAKSAVRELADQAAHSVRASTVGRVEHLAGITRNTAQEKGTDMLTIIRQNPVPAAIAAFGLGWLWMQRSDAQPTYGSQFQTGAYGQNTGRHLPEGGQVVGQAQQMAGQIAGQAQQVVGQLAGQAQEMTGQLTGSAQETAGQVQHRAKSAAQGISMDPIAIGALGIAAGAVAALLLPETEQEQQLMGDARDRVVNRVQEMGGETVEKVQRVASEVGKAAMNEAQAQGLTANP